MEQTETIHMLDEVFQKVLDDPSIKLTASTTAEDVEGWDSLNHIIIIVEIERRFGIKFQAAEMEELKNVGELADLIDRRIAKTVS